MKNRLIAAISLIIALSCIAFVSFRIGIREGIRHAIEESKVYAEGSSVFIDMDGQVYEHYID